MPGKLIGKVLTNLKQVYKPNAGARPTDQDFYWGVDVQVSGPANNSPLYDIPVKDINNVRRFVSIGSTVELTEVMPGRWEVTGVVNLAVANGTVRYVLRGQPMGSQNLGFTSHLVPWNQFSWAVDLWGQIAIFDRFGNRVN